MKVRRSIGVAFQDAALFNTMSVEDNIALALREHTQLAESTIRLMTWMKLAVVGLADFGHLSPQALSGGMRKRAAVARALALDPEILVFDEPSAGLDPITSRRLDELILRLRDSLGTTIVVVTHELASIFTIADTSIFLDAETKTVIAQGNPRELVREGHSDPKVREFLLRGDPTKTPIGLPREDQPAESLDPAGKG